MDTGCVDWELIELKDAQPIEPLSGFALFRAVVADLQAKNGPRPKLTLIEGGRSSD